MLSGLGVLLLGLTVTGKLNWLLAAGAALLPLIPRGARFLMGVWPSINPYVQRYQQNHQPNMQTPFLHLKIDMLSGQLQGEVLEGEFAGQSLQSLSLEQLLKLLEWFKQKDGESAALLVAYLDRQHAGWGGSSAEPPFAESQLSLQQAREILGVMEGAGKKEIIKAHKRLMQKVHPDRGGTDYLAQQINKARDTLLKNVD